MGSGVALREETTPASATATQIPAAITNRAPATTRAMRMTFIFDAPNLSAPSAPPHKQAAPQPGPE